ncbi:MAG: DedA family protein [Candidatus Kapaibacterium sp.]|nr:MAG: DedA family protein [Candidatus Kapabacteria bacterium]
MGINWHTFITEYGLWGLGGASFLSATLIPLSSEALLVAALAVGMPIAPAFAACSVGNCLACLLNYSIGALLRVPMLSRLEKNRSGQRAMAWMERWGHWSLLGSWLPFIGDPLTIVAGTVRVHLLWFVLIVCGLRVARFVATLFGAQMLHIGG